MSAGGKSTPKRPGSSLLRTCAYCGLPSSGYACVAHSDLPPLERFQVELAAIGEPAAGELVAPRPARRRRTTRRNGNAR